MKTKATLPITTQEAAAILKNKLGQWLSEEDIQVYLETADSQDRTDASLLVGNCQSYWARKLEDADYWT